MTARRSGSWKALLAMLIGGGAVAWHTMACVESPMSFSPNGDLAFTVMEPYDPNHIGKAGDFVYRLMILGKDRKLKEVEASRTHLLSGPGYSPDGERIAYLKIPLFSDEDLKRVETFIEKRKPPAADSDVEEWIFAAPEGSVARAPAAPLKNTNDLTLPPYGPGGRLAAAMKSGGAIVPVELVVRNAATGEQVASISFDMPFPVDDHSFVWDYLLAHPQYHPDGNRIFVWTYHHILAVDPVAGRIDLLAAPAADGLLSPDGQTVAALVADNKSLGLLRSDGSKATYVRLHDEPSLSGLAWLGDNSLAVLSPDESTKDAEQRSSDISVYDTNGNLLRTTEIPFSSESDVSSGELAISPDGEHMVVSFGEKVQFLGADGNVLNAWVSTEDHELLVQPTFTPDSRQVAFKLVGETKDEGPMAIVFFTPEGQELFRIPVPPAAPAPPAEAPELRQQMQPQPEPQPQQTDQ